MKLFQLLRLDAKNNPDALLRLFLATTTVSLIVILFLTGSGFHEVLQRYIISNAEDDARNVCNALLLDTGPSMSVLSNGRAYPDVRSGDIPRLDLHLRKFLGPFNIHKIKIYTADGQIVYSTDKTIIGQFDRDNPRLKRALRGQYDSHVERKFEVRDLTNEKRFDVDVVETYVPIKDKNNKVLGCFETYIDVTKYRDQTELAVIWSVLIVAFAQLLVFVPSFLMIRKVTRNIRKMQKELTKQAITDPLTGLYNKRQIEMLIRKEFAMAIRGRKRGLAEGQVGCIMIDIDRFKQINDSFGHLAGDHLLRQFAERVSSSLRVYDALGRFGGDEFVVILPGSGLSHSCGVARKIWALVRDEPFHVGGRPVKVTLSLGVSVSEAGEADSTCMIKRADDALYLAKENGRDRYEPNAPDCRQNSLAAGASQGDLTGSHTGERNKGKAVRPPC
jgi:diguanylate cyclase